MRKPRFNLLAFCLVLILGVMSSLGLARSVPTAPKLEDFKPSLAAIAFGPDGQVIGFTGNPTSQDFHEAFATLRAQAPPTTPAPGSIWSGALFVSNPKHPTAAAVILTRLTRFTNVAGQKGWNVELDAFAGAQAKSGAAPSGTSGFSLGVPFLIASNVNGYIGGAIAITPGQPTVPGIIAGVTIKFRKMPSISTLARMHH